MPLIPEAAAAPAGNPPGSGDRTGGRPADDFRFFAIGSSVPQRTGAAGPRVALPLDAGLGVGTDGSVDGLVLRDLLAGARGGQRPEGSPISRAAQVEPLRFEGCFAQDEVSSTPATDRAGFTAADAAGPEGTGPYQPAFGGTAMLDFQAVARPPIPRIEVTDYIEMGRLVAQWASDPAARPASLAELRRQLADIATVPDRIRSFEFVQGTLDHVVLRLPEPEMVAESLDRATDPVSDGRYPLPQFYADHCRPGFGPVMTPLDTLLARIGDHTIAQCR
jgi:hypothetical protein